RFRSGAEKSVGRGGRRGAEKRRRAPRARARSLPAQGASRRTRTAGTLVAAAKILKEKGARSVRAAVTHGVLNDTARERLSAEDCPLDHLMTTNTTLPRSTDPEIITRISIAPLLGEAINRIHVNKSVTGLFQVQGY
ncbi:MAG: hypothetical protein AAGB06_00265, partial [Verrucomicrobiota bacterium]